MTNQELNPSPPQRLADTLRVTPQMRVVLPDILLEQHQNRNTQPELQPRKLTLCSAATL